MKPFLTGETTSTRETRHEEIATLPLGRNYRFLARKRDSTAGRARRQATIVACPGSAAALACCLSVCPQLRPGRTTALAVRAGHAAALAVLPVRASHAPAPPRSLSLLAVPPRRLRSRSPQATRPRRRSDRTRRLAGRAGRASMLAVHSGRAAEQAAPRSARATRPRRRSGHARRPCWPRFRSVVPRKLAVHTRPRWDFCLLRSLAIHARSRSLALAALARTAVLAVLVRWLRSLAPPCWPRSLKPPAPRSRVVLAHPCTRPSMARKKAKKLT
jgi:hypothetical protein